MLVFGLLAAGCDGSSKPDPKLADAKPFADSFVRRLVEIGTWEAVEADVSPQLTPQLRGFQAHITHDGIDRMSRPGVLRHNCPSAPAVDAGDECFVYVISGRQVVPIGGVRKLRARFRLWPAYEGGRWQVINYDYEVMSR